MSKERSPIEIEVRPAKAPDDSNMVLLQLPWGYVLLPPDGAREVAQKLTLTAEEVERA